MTSCIFLLSLTLACVAALAVAYATAGSMIARQLEDDQREWDETEAKQRAKRLEA